MRENNEAATGRAHGLEAGWTVFSYLIAGLVSYGAIGWLVARVTHVPVLFPLGMLLGIAVSVGFVIYRYGKQGAADIDIRAKVKK
jgi:F0F1-type ATP synthase assembly protein I